MACAQTLPNGHLWVDPTSGAAALKRHKSNKVLLFADLTQDPVSHKPVAMLSLTPKQSLGDWRARDVGLNLDGNRLLIGHGKGGIALCEIDGWPRAAL